MRNESKLLEQIALPENLLAAWRAVRGNVPHYRRSRSSGPDGVSLTEFERDLPAQLDVLHHQLLNGRYEPQSPGLFSVPKKSGGVRWVALLNVSDRVAQRATQQVIEPYFEREFLPCSFGFRPGRSTEEAVQAARSLRRQGLGWVVDGDIAACFEKLDHRLLLSRLAGTLDDRRVLALISRWLEAGCIDSDLDGAKDGQQASSHEPGKFEQGWRWAWQIIYPSANSYPDGENGYYLDPYRVEGQPEEAQVHLLELQQEAMRRRALQQITSSTFLFGASWIRLALSKLGSSAAAAVKSPAGRMVLKRGALTGGGVVGAVAGAAALGYWLYRRYGPTPAGVLQGSPLSPLFANVYLHPFDLTLAQGGYHLVRFADDWLILCPSQAGSEAAYNDAVRALAALRLKVNPQKTRILAPGEAFEWLGKSIPA